MYQNAPPAFHLLAKPTGAVCNLDCKYCFFLSKEILYPGSNFRMADELLETYICQLLESHQVPEVNIAWQGGEPTLIGLDFFKRSVEYAEKYKKTDQQILYTIQTNGTKLDDEWCAFFKEQYRLNKGGKGSFDQVMRGLEHLKKHQVDFNILCTIHSANQDHPLEVYHFFRDELGAQYIQFIPIVERATPDTLPMANMGWSEGRGGKRPMYTQSGNLVTDRSVNAEQYGRFLNAIFDEWVRRDVGKVFVQMFDVALGSWVGQHNLCVFSPTCGNALVLEHNGDLYSCDHFVEPDYLLGNIQETHMIELIASDRQRQFGKHKLESLPHYCQECEVRFACHGGCPRERFIETPDGEPGLNFLCAGYKLFFNHIDHSMQIMANLLRRGRYADEVMNIVVMEEMNRMKQAMATAKSGDPCPCGSGKKYKLCHGHKRAVRGKISA